MRTRDEHFSCFLSSCQLGLRSHLLWMNLCELNISIVTFWCVCCLHPPKSDDGDVCGKRLHLLCWDIQNNSFETGSEAGLPACTTYCPVGNNLLELLRTTIINRPYAGRMLSLEISHHSSTNHGPSNLSSLVLLIDFIYHNNNTLLWINSSHSVWMDPL